MKRRSSVALFMDGFFSFMHPFYREPPKFGRVERREIEPPDIGRYFQRVGEMLSAAYRREGETLGIKVEHE